MDNDLKPIPPIRPFQRFVIQNFPFIEKDFQDLDSYGLWCKVIEYVRLIAKSQNECIDEVNQLADYVENYFKNLDVQEEINNKLDEMVESGELQEIIDQFLQANALWTFDTVSDMKNATNLIAGSYAKTLGYHSINDGGGATYFITDTGTANEMDVIAVGSLYANLVINNSTLNVKQFGAYGDNTNDDTTVLNSAFQYAYTNKLNVFIPNGTFLVSDTININAPQDTANGGFTIAGETRTNTTIKASVSLTDVITIKPYDDNTTCANMFFKNIAIDGNNLATNGINIKGTNFTNSRIENLFITKCSNAGITNETEKPNVYLSSIIKVRVSHCGIGIKLQNGINTSLRIADCYAVSCTNGYAIKGNYCTFENNCCDHATDTVFKFTSYTGTIVNVGSECPDASYVFYFERANATVINAWTYGNMESNEAVHIMATTASKIKFIGGKVLINPTTSAVDGEAEGKLYQLAQDCTISFDGTEYSSYKLANSYNEPTNFITDNDNRGSITKRYGGIISYIGRDTQTSDGVADGKDEGSELLANAIYFGLGDEPRYSKNGYDYRWKRKTVQGDILLSRNVKNIGGIGWVQADDTFAEGASQYWVGGTYMKIPVIQAGTTADRPTVNLVAGQMYFDTTLGKPIWFKTGSTWVDATGTAV